MPEQISLLPCPFCGFDKPIIKPNGIGDFYVICEDPEDQTYACGASSSDERCESQVFAAERWNKRSV